MGFSSWTCGITNLPILNYYSENISERFAVTVLFPDGKVVQGVYDGYGKVDVLDGTTIDLAQDHTIWPARRSNDEPIENFKIVLTAFYTGQTYVHVNRPQREPGQGHFHNSDAIALWWANQRAGNGFKTYEDYVAAYEAVVRASV